jgi:hypothetical protein
LTFSCRAHRQPNRSVSLTFVDQVARQVKCLLVMMSYNTLSALEVMPNCPCEKIRQDMFCMSFDRGREFTNPWEHGIHPRPRCTGDCNALCLVRNHLVHRMPRPVGVKENVQKPESVVPDVFEKDSWIHNVWTCQEIANSKQLYIVGESFDDVALGQGSLSAVGHFLRTIRKRRPSTLSVSRTMPVFLY